MPSAEAAEAAPAAMGLDGITFKKTVLLGATRESGIEVVDSGCLKPADVGANKCVVEIECLRHSPKSLLKI